MKWRYFYTFFLAFCYSIVVMCLVWIFTYEETPTREQIYPDCQGTIGERKIDSIGVDKYKFYSRAPWQNHKVTIIKQ